MLRMSIDLSIPKIGTIETVIVIESGTKTAIVIEIEIRYLPLPLH
jgi:hypothetical protein